MTATTAQGTSLIAMLVSMSILSWGTTNDNSPVTVAGSIILALAMAVLTVIRYIDTKEES